MDLMERSARRRYDSLKRAVVDFKLVRKGRVVTAVIFLGALVLLVSLTRYEGQLDFDRRFTIALFALLGAAFIATCAGIMELAAILISELERVKTRLGVEDDDGPEEEVFDV